MGQNRAIRKAVRAGKTDSGGRIFGPLRDAFATSRKLKATSAFLAATALTTVFLYVPSAREDAVDVVKPVKVPIPEEDQAKKFPHRQMQDFGAVVYGTGRKVMGFELVKGLLPGVLSAGLVLFFTRARDETHMSPSAAIAYSPTVFRHTGEKVKPLDETQREAFRSSTYARHFQDDGIAGSEDDYVDFRTSTYKEDSFEFDDVATKAVDDPDEREYLVQLYKRAIQHATDPNNKEQYGSIAVLDQVMLDLLQQDNEAGEFKEKGKADQLRNALVVALRSIYKTKAMQSHPWDDDGLNNGQNAFKTDLRLCVETGKTSDGEPGSVMVRLIPIPSAETLSAYKFEQLCMDAHSGGGEAFDRAPSLREKYEERLTTLEQLKDDLKETCTGDTPFDADKSKKIIDAALGGWRPQEELDRIAGLIESKIGGDVSKEDAIDNTITIENIPPEPHYLADRWEQLNDARKQMDNKSKSALYLAARPVKVEKSGTRQNIEISRKQNEILARLDAAGIDAPTAS